MNHERKLQIRIIALTATAGMVIGAFLSSVDQLSGAILGGLFGLFAPRLWRPLTEWVSPLQPSRGYTAKILVIAGTGMLVMWIPAALRYAVRGGSWGFLDSAFGVLAAMMVAGGLVVMFSDIANDIYGLHNEISAIELHLSSAEGNLSIIEGHLSSRETDATSLRSAVEDMALRIEEAVSAISSQIAEEGVMTRPSGSMDASTGRESSGRLRVTFADIRLKQDERWKNADTGRLDEENRQATEPVRLLGGPVPIRESERKRLIDQFFDSHFPARRREMLLEVGVPDREVEQLTAKPEENWQTGWRVYWEGLNASRKAEWVKEDELHPHLGLWGYRGKMVKVEGWEAFSREEVVIHVKNFVLTAEAEVARLHQEVERLEKAALENLS